MNSARGRDVSTALRGEGWRGEHQRGFHGGRKRLSAYQAAPLRTWTVFLRAAQSDLAIIEAPVVYAVHIVAPLPLLCTTNQVNYKGYSRKMIPMIPMII
jgi:hypothetical protein